MRLTPELALALLEPVTNGRAITGLEALSGGLANSNFRVTFAGPQEPLVVRVYQREPSACAREQALYALVTGTVPVAKHLYADGSCERAPWPYAVLSFVDGVPLLDAIHADSNSAGAVGHALGRTLAALGGWRFSQAGFFTPELTVQPSLEQPDAFLLHMQECLFAQGGAERLGEPLASTVWSFICDNAGYLPQPGAGAVLAHGDFKAGNILMRRDCRQGSWAIAALLDWEFAFAGPPLDDFAPLLRFAHQLPPDFEHGVVAGYEQGGGVLPPAWKRSVKLLDFANLCDFLAAPNRGGTLLRDVRDLMRRTLADWDSLPA